ncbi:MAG TPA: enoyl-CoA hydratase, partial [Deltaproteobacteria bacterium]|nr:enoyl-CoA hydratase [Deltaproteobacteria bacterium]
MGEATSERQEREYCVTERAGRILTVTINRPERMNALHW